MLEGGGEILTFVTVFSWMVHAGRAPLREAISRSLRGLTRTPTVTESDMAEGGGGERRGEGGRGERAGEKW